MRKSRLTEEQIVGFIRRAGARITIKQPRNKCGFADAFYRWGAKYGDMGVKDAKPLREPGGEIAHSKRLLADPLLDLHSLDAALGVMC